MTRIAKTLLLVLLVSALVWGAVIWHWQASEHAVQQRDILVYLVALPLVVIVGVFALRWAWRAAQAKHQAQAAAPAEPAPAAAVVEPTLTWRLLAHAAVVPGAEDAGSALELAAQPPAVALDPQLRDRDTMGVFTRRSECADPAADDAPARALLLAERCLEPVFAWLQEAHAQRQQALPPRPSSGHPSIVPTRLGAPPAPARPVLRVWWAVPEDATAQQQAAVQQAMAPCVEQWAKVMPLFDWQFELLPIASGERALLRADHRLQVLHRERVDEMLLLVAAHSSLDRAAVAQWDGADRLFTAQGGRGVMPGEAAAALLLAPPGPGALQLHRVAVLRRDKSADGPGRIAARELTEAARQVLAASAVQADAVAWVLSDIDARSPRGGELYAAMHDNLPLLSAAEQCLRVGEASGEVGLAAAPLAVALAAEKAKRDEAPVIALTNAGAFDRLAAIIAPEPPAGEPAATNPTGAT